MTKFTITINKKQIEIMKKACALMGFTYRDHSGTSTTVKVDVTYGGKEITPTMIFKLGRVCENEFVFKSEIDFNAEWRALFTTKQTTIKNSTTAF